jgi:hypothetical protein
MPGHPPASQARRQSTQGGFVNALLDTVGESFELNIIAAQETGTLTGTVRPIAIDQGSVPGKLNFGDCRTP